MHIGIRNMQEDFTALNTMAAYQAEVELGNIPQYQEQEDGTYLATDTTTQPDGTTATTTRNISPEIAMAEINAKLEDGMAQRITTLQSNLIARASIDSMQTSGSFSFEKMSDTETTATLNTMATAAGMRISAGAKPDSIDPSLSTHLSLGQLTALPAAAKHRMQIAGIEGNTSPFASNAYRISLSKSKTLIRFVEGKIGINELLEETVETHLSHHFQQTGTTPQWAAEHLRKAQRLLRQSGTIKHDLITPEGDVTHMQVIEAMGTLAQADFLHRVDSLTLPEFIKDFIKWARNIISQAAHLANLGKTIRELDAAGKLDKTFTQAIYDAAGITQQFWKDAAIDSTHQTLARIATAAIAPHQTTLTTSQDITNGAYQAWLNTTTLKDEDTTAPPTNNTTTDIQSSFSIAPNGKKSNLTQKQWNEVRTEEFKKWFGDWENDPENASKAVDENGEPMVVYHGTWNEFSIFDRDKLGSPEEEERSKIGFWFSKKEFPGFNYPSWGGHYMNVFLNIRKPRQFESLDELDGNSQNAEQFIKDFTKDGYDGVSILHDRESSSPSFVAFYPNQIKSATDNRGTFDSENSDISFSIASRFKEEIATLENKQYKSPDGKAWDFLKNGWELDKEMSEYYMEEAVEEAVQEERDNIEQAKQDPEFFVENYGDERDMERALDDYNEENDEDLDMLEWASTEDAKAQLHGEDRINAVRSGAQDNDSVMERAEELKASAMEARDEMIEERMELLKKMIQAAGWSVRVDHSKVSDSHYFYVSPPNDFDSTKIRYSDHQDKHGGSDMNLYFSEKLGDAFKEVHDFLEEWREENQAEWGDSIDDESDISFSIAPQDNEQWKNDLMEYATGKNTSARPLRLSSMPDIFSALGYTEHDVVMLPNTVDKLKAKHDLTDEQIQALAQAINDPILIVNSATQADSIVALTEIKTDKGHVVAAIHLDKNTKLGARHVVASAYPKENGGMISSQIKQGGLLYVDKKRALAWARSNGLQLPKVASQKGKPSVLTPEDVVKWKNAHGAKSIPLSDFLKGDLTDTTSFSVIGTHSKNWEHIKHKAFTGRDDGMLRVELDASQATITPDTTQRIERRLAKDKAEKKVRFTLKNILHYPALYQAYPKLADMAITLTSLGARGTRAWYSPKTKKITINTLNFDHSNYDTAALRSTLLHEIQHAIFK